MRSSGLGVYEGSARAKRTGCYRSMQKRNERRNDLKSYAAATVAATPLSSLCASAGDAVRSGVNTTDGLVSPRRDLVQIKDVESVSEFSNSNIVTIKKNHRNVEM